MYSNITTKVVSIISSVHSGIGVFVPSYAVLESIVNMIKPKISGRSLIVETKDLTNQDTNLLIEKFKSEKGSLLLAVQGGRFSEGENFRDEQMDVSIVVGLSLPPPSPALFAEYAYYAKIHRDSYLLISLLPALRKAFQATGRHIRNPEKRGLVFLLDSRFNDQRVIDLMPSWLKNDLIIGDFSSTEIAEIIKNFEFN
jgi:DNA excision repair protein ERCC-2